MPRHLTIENHRKPQRHQPLLPTQRIIKLHAPTPLLPIALLKQEAHSRTTTITHQDCLKRLRARRLRKNGSSNKLIQRRWIIPRAHAGRVRRDAPHVRLRGVAGGDLVGVLERRVLDFQHAAGCASWDVVEGHYGDELVGALAAGTGEVEDLPVVGLVGVTFLEDIDYGGAESGTGAADEVGGGGIGVGGGSGEGGGEREEGGCEEED
jgi:hypothetical protein